MSNQNFSAIGALQATVGIGQYIVNDYVLTLEPLETGDGYTLTIRKGSDVQTVTLEGLSEENLEIFRGYVAAAQAAQLAAEGAQTAAETAQGNAEDAQAAAEAAQSVAETAQVAAETAETNAGASATQAGTSASSAAQSATQAAGSAAAAAQTLTDVQAAGQAQIAAIGAEGERVLETIPEDYTELSDDVGNLKTEMGDVLNLIDYTPEETATLSNRDSLEYIVGKYAATLVSYTDGIKTFTFGNGSETNPAIAHSNMSLTNGKWLVGFKYRLTKIAPSVSNPDNMRVLIGSTTYDSQPQYGEWVYGEWLEFNQVFSGAITQVYIALRGFNPAPSSGQFQIEIKDYYIYDASDLDDDMIAYVRGQQSADYQDGTVEYTKNAQYLLDETLTEEGKCPDSKAVGNALSLTTQTLSQTFQNNVNLINIAPRYGLTSSGISGGVSGFVPSSNPDVSPSVRDTCALGAGKWLVGFKYKITKLDDSLGDPECVRLYIGDLVPANLIDYTFAWDEWINISEVKTVNLSQIYFAVRNFATAPVLGQFKLEIKDYYVYNVASVDPELLDFVISQQKTDFADGTKLYKTKAFSDSLQNSLGVINVKNYGVVGDGTTDDTLAINKLFSTHQGNFYFPAGTYKITGTIELPKNSALIGDGDDTVIDMHSCDNLTDCLFNDIDNWRIYPYILARNDNVTISKIKVIGNNSLQEKRHAAILIMDAKNCAVQDVTIYNINFDAEQDTDADVSGYGVCVNRSQYVTVERVNAQRCGYECIGIVFACNYCVVRDCYTQDGWRTCIQVHRGSCNTLIENCYMKQTHTKYEACFTVHGLVGHKVKNLRVIGCVAEITTNGAQPHDYNAPYQIMSYAQSLWFAGNRVLGGRRALHVNSSCDNCRIIGNDFACNDTSDYGVSIGSANAIISGNILVNESATPTNYIASTAIITGNYGIS